MSKYNIAREAHSLKAVLHVRIFNKNNAILIPRNLFFNYSSVYPVQEYVKEYSCHVIRLLSEYSCKYELIQTSLIEIAH